MLDDLDGRESGPKVHSYADFDRLVHNTHDVHDWIITRIDGTME